MLHSLGTRFMSRRAVPRRWKSVSTDIVVVPPPSTNLAPVWGSATGTTFTITQGGTLNLNSALGFTDPESDPMEFFVTSGTLPTGVTLERATGILTAAADATTGLSGDIVISASDTPFWDIPTLADERATYDALGWTRTGQAAGQDETFDFAATRAPFGALSVHGDFESDDLWTWFAQYRRGYADGSHTQTSLVTNWYNAWKTYYRDGQYEIDVSTEAQPLDHLFGYGLVSVGHLLNDPVALATAERLGDLAIYWYSIGRDRVTPPAPTLSFMQYGGRHNFRYAILFNYLAQAIGSSKWIFWRDAIMDHMCQTSSWAEAPTNGLVQGGQYFLPRSEVQTSFSGTGNGNEVQYDAGRRYHETFFYSNFAEALWRGYLATGRADIKDKLIKIARFIQYYAHDPADVLAGGPFCHNWFGQQSGSSGPFYHKHINGTTATTVAPTSAYASVDGQLVNQLVFGYKLTGDTALLARAREHLRKGTRWGELQPLNNGTGPVVPVDQVSCFIDTRKNPDLIFFNQDKGQLQYTYAIFENNGNPVVLDTETAVTSNIKRVGPTRTYTTIRSAVLAAVAGDIILIDAGDYLGDHFTITQANLTLRGTGGRANLRANGTDESGKGIIDHQGTNTTFENLNFYDAAVADQNGAGIRLDGNGLTTIRNCGFYDCENGILSGGGGNVFMEFCEFARCGKSSGPESGFDHNVYFGTHKSVVARDCYFHEAKVGHEFKSRARETTLERCYLVNGTGSASYLVNCDNGGKLILRGCCLHKGTSAQNSNTIFHNTNTWGTNYNSITLEYCTLRHDYSTGAFINLASGSTVVTLKGSLFASNGRPLVSGGTPVQTSNYQTTASNVPNAHVIADPNFWIDSSISSATTLGASVVTYWHSDAPHIYTSRTVPVMLRIGAIQSAP